MKTDSQLILARLMLAAILAAAICTSCAPPARQPNEARAKAEQAKMALLEYARTNPGVFHQMDPEIMKDVPLTRNDEDPPDKFHLGGFHIDVGRRTYYAEIGNMQWHQFYNGEFAIDAGGRWHATKPHVTYADK